MSRMTLLKQKILKRIKPPEKLLPSTWCEQNLYLPDGRTAGQKIALYPFQREMLNVCEDPKYKKVVYKTSSQIAKTTLLNCILFYWIVNDSSNIAIGQSSLTELKKWKNGKIQKMIELSPTLQPYFSDPNDKRKANNQNQVELASKDFLYFLTLGSPKQLRGITCKRIILDEIAAVEQSEEGSPIRLAEQRAAEWNGESKILLSSTPTFSGDSIDVEYQNSDQRNYFIHCPHCDHEHTIDFQNIKFDFKKVGRRELPDPETAKLICPCCQKEITDSQRIKAVATGRWIATNPDVKDVAGFFINRLYSSNFTIKDIVTEFSLAFYEFNCQAFYNTVLGLHYSELQDDLNDVALEALRDEFDIRNIPSCVEAICIGCDQQLDRVECQTIAFSKTDIYVLDHRIFYDVNTELRSSKAYVDLVNYINTPFKTVSGKTIPVLNVALDSGNGRATKIIYSVCANHRKLNAIKGSSSTKSELFRKSRSDGYEFYVLNVHELKLMVRQLLNDAVNERESAMNIHFSNSLCDDYFSQLTSEELKRAGGNVVFKLIPGRRNECLDCLAYAIAMMKLSLSQLGKDPFRKLRTYNYNKNKTHTEGENTSEPDTPDKPQAPPAQQAATQRKRRTRDNNPFGKLF